LDPTHQALSMAKVQIKTRNNLSEKKKREEAKQVL
jgi:hypothetical protein